MPVFNFNTPPINAFTIIPPLASAGWNLYVLRKQIENKSGIRGYGFGNNRCSRN
jgi:hypothetical protein